MRVIILIARASSLQALTHILTSTLVVALSETEGVSLSTGDPTPCELLKKNLYEAISGAHVTYDEDEREDPDDPGDQHDSSVFVLDESPSSETVKEWCQAIVLRAKEAVIDDGDRDNIMHNPMLVSKLQNLMYVLPLWTYALPHKMNSPYPRGIGAYVETEFGQLKQNLITKSERVDDFVTKYLKVCDGTVKIGRAILILKSGNNSQF